MTARDVAVLNGDTVVNVLVVDENTPNGWLKQYIDSDDAITSVVYLPGNSEIGIGHVRGADGKFTRPASLTPPEV